MPLADGCESWGSTCRRRPQSGADFRTDGWLPLLRGVGFDVLLSNDKNLVFQLNLATIQIAIVTLPTNRQRIIVRRSQDIADTLRRVRPRQHVAIELDGRRTVRRSGFAGAVVMESMAPVAPFIL